MTKDLKMCACLENECFQNTLAPGFTCQKQAPSSNQNVEKLLRDVAADAQLVGYRSPAQNALLAGADELKRMKQELWVIAECIFRNVSSDDAKHWARDIKVSLQSGDQAPRVTVETTERCIHGAVVCEKCARMAVKKFFDQHWQGEGDTPDRVFRLLESSTEETFERRDGLCRNCGRRRERHNSGGGCIKWEPMPEEKATEKCPKCGECTSDYPDGTFHLCAQ